MKRRALIFFCIFLLLAGVALTAVAAPAKTEVEAERDAAAGYVYSVLEGDVAYDDDATVLLLLRAGVGQIGQAYLTALRAELDANEGKLLYYGAESGAYYARAALILDLLGEDPTNFHGYDLLGALAGMDREAVLACNPYLLAPVLEAAARFEAAIGDDTFVPALVGAMMRYYIDDPQKGTGFDYYGVSVDTNALCIVALQPYAEENDAVAAALEASAAWLLTQKTQRGYHSTPAYPGENANSTGLALAAWTALGDMDEAADAYAALLGYRSSAARGAYVYGQEDNLLSTVDALNGLLAYAQALPETAALDAPQAGGDEPVAPKTGDAGATGWALIAFVAAAGFIVSARAGKRCAR